MFITVFNIPNRSENSILLLHHKALFLFIHQVWSADIAGGFRGVPDEVHSDRSWSKGPAAVWEGTQTSGEPDGWGSLHDPVQQDRAPHAKDDYHGIRGEFHREHSDAHPGNPQLTKPNFIQKLTLIGVYMFSLFLSQQQLHAIIAASVSIKSSQKLKKILEVSVLFWFWCTFIKTERVFFYESLAVSPSQIVLALGNYMNSSKRGAVYGFKLQSLDLVTFLL